MTDANDKKQSAAPADESFIVDEATDAVLRLQLDKFEGPFEVLLYLIKSQEIDIFDIPIVKITEQYIRFLELLRDENLDVAGEFLVMAATLIHIKSKMILPVEQDIEEEEVEEEDPRLDLVEKLLEYRKYRDVARRLQALEDMRLNWFTRNVKPDIQPDEETEELLDLGLYDLIQAFRGVLRYISDDLAHTVVGEGASVDEKIAYIEQELTAKQSIAWIDLFKECRSRVELVCCFLAILELCRMGKIRAHQHQAFGDIRIFAREAEAPAEA
jgi:segregation and condensation protein A